jgi:hypothetical protein
MKQEKKIMRKLLTTAIFTVILLSACGSDEPSGKNTNKKINIDYIAERYLILAFQLNKFDNNYVDNYFGPDSLKRIADADSISLKEISARVDTLLNILDTISDNSDDFKTRKKFLGAMMKSLKAKSEILNGKKYSFDEECKLLYGVNVPILQENYYQKVLIKIDSLLPPAKKSLNERYQDFVRKFIVPTEKLDTVFRLAIEEGRRRTKEYIELIPGEEFRIEYVSGKSWAAYNWYKGSGRSLIEVNADVPFTIDKVINLAFHEGYPGHHVYHQLMERQMVWEKKWIEYSIYPLFSPMAVISEGTANYGVEVIMTKEEKLKFEKEILFPAAGLDTSDLELFYEINQLKGKLNYASNDAARFFLEGKKTKVESAAWLAKHQLRTETEALRFLDFIETYRTYVINYNYGMDLVKDYIESHGGKNDKHIQKSIFKKIITSSVIPSDLKN